MTSCLRERRFHLERKKKQKKEPLRWAASKKNDINSSANRMYINPFVCVRMFFLLRYNKSKIQVHRLMIEDKKYHSLFSKSNEAN